MAQPPSGRQFEIASGDHRVTLVEVGGGIRRYTFAGRDVLDGYAKDAICTSGRGQALLQWPNRIDGGSYEFGGEHQQLALTEPTPGTRFTASCAGRVGRQWSAGTIRPSARGSA